MEMIDSDKRRKELRNYVNYLLSKGRSKKQIREELLEKGFNRYLVREVIYPNLKLLVYCGVVLICMILIIGGVYFFAMMKGKNIDFKPIASEQTLKSVGGIEVDDVEIREIDGQNVVEVYLINKGDEFYDSPIEIRVSSGDFYLTWIDPRGIGPGEISMSSALGFMMPEKTVKVFLNSEEVYEEVFVFG